MELTLSEQILILLREKGPLTIEEIASYLRRDTEEVSKELQYLEHDKLVTRVKRGLVFRREAFDLTPTGLEEAQRAYEKLRGMAYEFINKINSSNSDEIEDLIIQYSSIIPLLMLLNLIPIELLALIDAMSVELYPEDITIDDSDSM
jgi:Mn-dependent DtxR family transcriptional regulator